jgi:hypothetical protein
MDLRIIYFGFSRLDRISSNHSDDFCFDGEPKEKIVKNYV